MLSARRFAIVRRMLVSGMAVPGLTDGTGTAGRAALAPRPAGRHRRGRREVALDVALHDPAAGAAAGDGLEGYVLLRGDRAGEGAGLEAAPRGPRGGGRRGDGSRRPSRRRGGRGSRRWGSRRSGRRRTGRRRGGLGQQRRDVLARVRDHADERADRSLAPGRHEDLAQDARAEGLHLHVGLVGLDLGEHVTHLDRVALRLVPLDDRALLHGGGELGEDDLRDHR